MDLIAGSTSHNGIIIAHKSDHHSRENLAVTRQIRSNFLQECVGKGTERREALKMVDKSDVGLKMAAIRIMLGHTQIIVGG